MTKEEVIRGALLQARIQLSAGLLDSADRFIALALSALAAPTPQEESKKPWPEVTLTAGAWRSLVAGLDEEGAEHETPITVCYDAEHDQGIYCYAEYPDDGARTIDPPRSRARPRGRGVTTTA